jgi:Ig-like domain CHU_C associated
MPKRASAAAALLLFLAAAASAAVFERVPTDRDLIDRADLIVVATIRGASTRIEPQTGWVLTDYEADVEETLKGTASASITITEVGGVAGERFTAVADSAAYAAGERVLVFLRRAKDGSYATAAMSFGKFEFARNAQGANVLLRGGDEPARLETEFKHFIRTGKAPAAYVTKLTPIASAVLQPKPAATAAQYCVTAFDGVNTRPIRWPGFPGYTVTFHSSSADPGGQIALRAAEWTSEPASFITLLYGGVDAIGSGPSASDGKNGIYINFTGTIPPNIPCDAAIGCAVESGNSDHTFNGEHFFSIGDADILVLPGGMSKFAEVVAHEMGHGIGLRHSNEGTPFATNAVMNSSVQTGSLQTWDREAAATVYGSGPPCQNLVITQHPADQTVPSGQSAFLGVQISGTSPTYQWYEGTKPDTTLPVGGNSPTFTTPPIVAVKKYWVRVSNSCSTQDSNTATITPIAAPNCVKPTITLQPLGATIDQGQKHTMTIEASGSAPFSIQWFEGQKGDKTLPVPGATSATFQTPALAATKSYWVSIVNACGEDQSNTATVNVRIPGQCNKPTFTIQPQGFAGQTGKPAILFALAAGEGTIAYQWFQGNAGDTTTPLGAGQSPSNTRWVNQLFVDVLGRIPDGTSLGTFTGLLGSGATRSAAALTLLTSNEVRLALINSYYQRFLRRAASGSEASFWLPMLTAGFSNEDVAAQILGSPEYFTLAGGTNAGFLTRLFQDVLGRDPSAADNSFFLPLLGSSSRTSVALTVLESLEARTRRVQEWYSQFLRRTPASAEVAPLLALSDENAMAAILGSEEYFNFPSMLITSPLSATTSFWVRATNSCGPTDSNVATVAFPACAAPVIVVQPANTTVNVGQAPSLSVVADGATTYQWFFGGAGVETNPIAGATNPVLNNVPFNTVGTTQVWVKVSNSCGSRNSAAANVTVLCAATKPVLTVPPITPAGRPFTILIGGANGATKFELQESPNPGFAPVKTYTNPVGSSQFTIETTGITKDTRLYYRAVAFVGCTTEPSAFSDVTSVLVTAPQPPNSPSFSFAQLPCPAPPCVITQTMHIDGFPTTGNSVLENDQFTVGSDKPWITVSPSSGILPPQGVDVTITINAAQLEVGSTQASLTVTTTPAPVLGKTGILNNTPKTKTVPVSVSLVAPVTAKPKDGNAPLNAMIIPVVAHADGIGTRFVSDVRLTNTSSQSITYDLTFTPSGIDGTTAGKQITLTVPAIATTALNDIVKDWYGSGTEGEPGGGTLEIRPRNYAAKDGKVSIAFASVAASRTYAVSAAGTFGQYIPALPVVDFLGKNSNSVISLQQVAQSPAYRTNFGLVEGLGQSANVVVSLFDDKGTVLARRSLTLRPFEAQQTRLDAFFNGFTLNGAPLPSIADARVEVSVTSDSGRVTAYASVLDNATTDPLLVFPVDPAKISAKRFVIPGVAEFDNGFSNFHTDMRIYNGGTSAANVTLNFSGSVVLPAVQRTIAAGEVLAVDNVLPTLWQASGGGAVIVTTANDAPLVTTARTFSRDASGGTFGQFIPGVTATDAVGVGDRSLQVVQLEQSPSFRSNLGLVEVTGNPVTVEILAWTPESKIAARTEKTLAASEFSQIGSIFSGMGFGSVYNGRISVRAVGGTGRVAAYGSVVDSRTADPTYVKAQ